MNALPIERVARSLPMPFSKAVQAGGFLFLSGESPMDAAGQLVAGDITVQTCAVIERVAVTLGECGAGLHDVVRATVRLGEPDGLAALPVSRNSGCRPARPAPQAPRPEPLLHEAMYPPTGI